MGKLTYEGDHFYLDGQPYTVLSGALHYFRIHPDYWESSLKKLKACGLNTVETYTCWNLHERKEGSFDFSGQVDVERFIALAGSLGLQVILRPGPFICAEWEFGGLPSWLLTVPGMRFRCTNAPFLEKVRAYFHELFRRLEPLMAKNGGPIFMVQIENEYGSFSHDKAYMRAIVDIYKECAVEELLFTADGNDYNMLTGGLLDDYLATINFGNNVAGNFYSIRERGRTHPLMVGEYWCGQFDHWYEPHRGMKPELAAQQLDEILSYGASVNLYMFQGGTNFGFTNGANYDGGYQPDITSYDYTALLDESGDRTEKYYAVKAVLEKHFGPAPEVEVADTVKAACGTVELTEMAPLFEQLDALSVPVKSVVPLTMEELGQDFGFILYTSYLEGPLDDSAVRIYGLQDRALIFIDGKMRGVKERDRRDDEVRLSAGFGQTLRLDILVENMGRINFSSRMPYERKGITGHVELVHGTAVQTRLNWTMRCLPLEDLSGLHWQPATEKYSPATFFRATFKVDKPVDTYLYLPGFTRGVAFLNGFNLGRYHYVGPQQTLYIPAPVMCAGDNELVIFEQEKAEKLQVQFLDHAILDELHI